MMDWETMQEYIDEQESPALKIDGHDNAILGAAHLGPEGEYILVYSEKRILDNLMKQGMDWTEAVEFFEFNVQGAFMGPGTPIIIDELVQEDL